MIILQKGKLVVNPNNVTYISFYDDKVTVHFSGSYNWISNEVVRSQSGFGYLIVTDTDDIEILKEYFNN